MRAIRGGGRCLIPVAALAAGSSVVSALAFEDQLIAVHPLVYVVPSFASQQECDSILERIERCHQQEWAECHEQQSRLHVKKERTPTKPLRNSTSFTLTIDGEVHEAFDPIVRRSHALARHPITFGEGVQIASYHEGHYYGFHHDSLMRRATLLLYLTDIPQGDGGETIFPLVRAPGVPDDAPAPLPPAVTVRRRSGLDPKIEKMEEMEPYCASDYYLKIRPEVGKAVLFYSYGPNYALDEFAIHGACPLRRGHKAIFQRWMRFEENTLFNKSSEAVRNVRSLWGRSRLVQPGEHTPENATNPYEEIAARTKSRRRARENRSETPVAGAVGVTASGTPAEL